MNPLKMRTFKQNKLLRDKIPDLLQPQGSKLYFVILSDEEFQKQLKNKLLEEALEVQHATTHHEMLEELADVLEVVEAMAKSLGFSEKELQNCKQKKREEKGGYDEKKFITIAEHPTGSPQEKYCLAHPDKYPEIKN